GATVARELGEMYSGGVVLVVMKFGGLPVSVPHFVICVCMDGPLVTNGVRVKAVMANDSDEDDSDTEEEVKEEEAIGKQEVAPPVSNQVEADNLELKICGEWELDTLLSSLTNLKELSLSYSGFSVTTNNANHYVNPGFQLLYLASCKLKVFPESFRAMKQLQELDLSGNEIHGQIPHWAGEIGWNELSLLDLSHNFITGLPQFQWYGLSELYLQSNLIEGPFPPSICNMSGLGFLDMSNNSCLF
ncbi:leucine-rich repeat-containing protein, partial [Tanacetum coccineum]